MNEMQKWFDKTTGNDSVNGAAKRTGIPQPTLSRRVKDGRLEAQDIILISRAYGKSPVTELVRLKMITRKEAKWIGDETILSMASDKEIAEEVWYRVTGEYPKLLTEPLEAEAPAPSDPEPNYRTLSVVPDSVAASKNDGTHNEFTDREQ